MQVKYALTGSSQSMSSQDEFCVIGGIWQWNAGMELGQAKIGAPICCVSVFVCYAEYVWLCRQQNIDFGKTETWLLGLV